MVLNITMDYECLCDLTGNLTVKVSSKHKLKDVSLKSRYLETSETHFFNTFLQISGKYFLLLYKIIRFILKMLFNLF